IPSRRGTGRPSLRATPTRVSGRSRPTTWRAQLTGGLITPPTRAIPGHQPTPAPTAAIAPVPFTRAALPLPGETRAYADQPRACGSCPRPPSGDSPVASPRSPRGREPQRIGMLRPPAIRTVDALDERGRAVMRPAGPTFDGHQTLPEPGRLDPTGSTRAVR